MAKKFLQRTFIEVEGNRGGSFIAITRKPSETIQLRVGLDCVVQVDVTIGVNDFATFLAKYAVEIESMSGKVQP